MEKTSSRRIASWQVRKKRGTGYAIAAARLLQEPHFHLRNVDVGVGIGLGVAGVDGMEEGGVVEGKAVVDVIDSLRNSEQRDDVVSGMDEE